jgi:adenylate cyclase
MAAGNISIPRPDHAEACAELALDLRREIELHNQQNGSSIRIRVGICTGSVVAGVIGREKFAYDLWSETVNLACRLESTAEPGKIQISESTCDRLKEKYRFEKRRKAGADKPTNPNSYWLGNLIDS